MAARATIAMFLDTGEALFLAPKHSRRLAGIVSEGTALEYFARGAFAGQLIPLHASGHKKNIVTLEETIKHTNLADALRRAGIVSLVVPSQLSSTIVRWARCQHIRLLGPSYAVQKKLGDKISFDRMVRCANIPVPSRITKKTLPLCENSNMLVAQKRNSMGCEGTSFVRSATVKKNPSLMAQSLVRTYVHGIPLGVSILMDCDGNYFYSALRRQCFALQYGFPKHFLGIQWLSTHTFSRNARAAIEYMLSCLVTLFQRISFVGIANIDLILAGSRAYVIECNPRFSTATPYIFSVPSLTPHPDPWTFLLNAFQGIKNIRIQIPSLPNSNFTGAIASIDVRKKTSAARTPPVGTSHGIFLLHDIERGAALNPDDTLCTLFSERPLFSKHGTLNAFGARRVCNAIRLFSP